LWPYGYYTFLRWFISFSAVVIAFGFYESKRTSWTLIFGAMAFLFNPLLPVYLNKSSWVGIDLISAFVFFISSQVIKNKNEKGL